MGKKIKYTFTGTFDIEVDGGGFGDNITFTELMRKFRKSNRFYTLNDNGNITISKTKTPPQKDWRLRFKNRFAKARDLLDDSSFDFPLHAYNTRHPRLQNFCGRLIYGGWGEFKLAFHGHCHTEDNPCISEQFHCNGGLWKSAVCTLLPDDSGTVIIQVTDLGNKFLKALKRPQITTDFIVGHLDDKDIVSKIECAIRDMVSTFGDCKFHD
jgi:hypothetical protein